MTEIADSPMETEVDSYDVVLVTNDGAESTIRCGSGTTVPRPLGVRPGAEVGMPPGRWLRGLFGSADRRPGGDGRPRSGRHRDTGGDGGILCAAASPRRLPHRPAVRPRPDRHRAADPASGPHHRTRPGGRRGDAASLTLLDDAGGPSSADFESGQFVRIWVPGRDARRAYSPATSPTGTVSWSSTSGCCPAGDVDVPGTAALGDEAHRDRRDG